jgi:hypothetical protein
MDKLVKEEVEMKLHPDRTNREGWFKVSKAWNPSATLLRYSQTHKKLKKSKLRTSRKLKEHREKCARKETK